LKTNRGIAADHLNADLTALHEYGKPWNIIFAPAKTSSLIISLKSGISEHPPLFLNDIQIPKVTSVRVLGFTFDSLFTWQKHIDNVLKRGRQRLGQVYHCHSLFECHDITLQILDAPYVGVWLCFVLRCSYVSFKPSEELSIPH